MSGNTKDFKVKAGIKPTVYHEGLGTVTSGSVGYYLAGASYDSKSFSFASQETDPQGLTLSSDGTKMYVLGVSSDTVYQYSLSTAFDVSTASYDSVSFSVSSQETVPTGLKFKSDGSKLFVVGQATGAVYQYSLSTSFDLSTASYDSVSFSLSSQTTSPNDIAFNTNGTKMYTIGWDGSTIRVFQYSLSTGFDLSTVSYDSISFDVGNEEFDGRDLAFNSTGTKMFVVGSVADSIFQYSLSTAFDLSSASYDSISFSVRTQATSPQALSFKGDGTQVYICDATTDTIYQYSTVQTTNTLDLSTGSVFEITPTSDVQVTLSNPAASGTVSAATLLLSAEETVGVSSTFSTTLYTGTSATQTITNGIDLAADGGLVWIKDRGRVVAGRLVDTERGATKSLLPSATISELTESSVTSFNSNGFTLGNENATNYSSQNFVSWTFKKQSSFFDVVTYTGNGVSGRQISHNLGTKPGFIIVKRTDTGNDPYNYWRTAHIDGSTLTAMDLNTTSDASTTPWILWSDSSTATSAYAAAQQTSTYFTVGNNASINGSGGSFVAYLFAHDTSADGLIQCGSAISGSTVNLGWEPQFIIGRWSDAASNWAILDTERGFTNSTDEVLYANTADQADNTNDILTPTSTGFTINSSWWGTTNTFIYIAIRASYVPTITYDPDLQWSGGTAPTAPAIGETDVITINTDDGGTTYKAVQAIDGAS